eukprot:9145999-Alexandrium_andersonii.AAC.1
MLIPAALDRPQTRTTNGAPLGGLDDTILGVVGEVVLFFGVVVDAPRGVVLGVLLEARGELQEAHSEAPVVARTG